MTDKWKVYPDDQTGEIWLVLDHEEDTDDGDN